MRSTSYVRTALPCGDRVKREHALLSFVVRDHLHCILCSSASFLERCSQWLAFCGACVQWVNAAFPACCLMHVMLWHFTCAVCKEEQCCCVEAQWIPYHSFDSFSYLRISPSPWRGARFAIMHYLSFGNVWIFWCSSALSCDLAGKLLTEARDKGRYLKMFTQM